MAKQTIDLLGVLREKTRNNLDSEEENLFDHLLYDLRMAYIKEGLSKAGGLEMPRQGQFISGLGAMTVTMTWFRDAALSLADGTVTPGKSLTLLWHPALPQGITWCGGPQKRPGQVGPTSACGKIPVAGLGAARDAAGALKALNFLYGFLDDRQNCGRLGADVPVFPGQGRRGRGIGTN
jgi:hypothetical protein